MRKSTASTGNQQIGDWSEWAKDKSNSDFFATALKEMNKFGVGNQGMMTIGFVGARDIPGATLRQAQSVLRWDRRPSLWSHVFLIGKAWDGKRNIDLLPIYEVPLHSRGGHFPRPENNGVLSKSKLRIYSKEDVDANVALITVCARKFKGGQCTGVTHLPDEALKALEARAKDFNYDRLRYDLWDSLGAWQRYLWSDGAGQNPLRAGVPVCASSYIEMVFEAIGLDIVPATSERNSAPEHVWNAAKWWHQNEHLDSDDVESMYEMRGCFAIRDYGCSMVDSQG